MCSWHSLHLWPRRSLPKTVLQAAHAGIRGHELKGGRVIPWNFSLAREPIACLGPVFRNVLTHRQNITPHKWRQSLLYKECTRACCPERRTQANDQGGRGVGDWGCGWLSRTVSGRAARPGGHFRMREHRRNPAPLSRGADLHRVSHLVLFYAPRAVLLCSSKQVQKMPSPSTRLCSELC